MNRSFQYRASEDRVYDATMETPRQIRLKHRREQTIAQYHEAARIVAGFILLGLLLLAAAFLA